MPRRPLLPASLRSAQVKFKRACLHERTGRHQTMRFFNRYPGPTFRIEPEGQTNPSRVIGAVNRFNVVCASAPPDLPDSFSARFADAIHNFRCVLDHIAWQLVIHGSSWPLPDNRARNAVQFPIYTAEGDFDASHARRLPGIDDDALRFIKARQKYAGGNATNDALLDLARLSNDDKHRELRFFLGAFLSLHAGVFFDDCEVVTWDPPAERPRVKEGAVVVEFSYRVTGPHPKVRMNVAPQGQIVDEDWRDFFGMLQSIRLEVRQILYAPEIIAAVS